MDNDPQTSAIALVFLGSVVALVGLMLVRSVKMLWQRAKLEHKYLTMPRLVEYSALYACKDLHDWQEVLLALRGIEAGRYRICAKCGVICNNEQLMLSKEAIAQMKETSEATAIKQAEEDAIADRVDSLADAYIEQYIKKNFTEEINDARMIGKLHELARYAFVAQTQAQDKIVAEMLGQTELEDRYASWSGKTKGNA